MGAYLSSPNREKESVDFEGKVLSYGASAMQGWRISQEDAHNCCPDFDPENKGSLFAVYDGHGGAEVAQYTADKFPEFLKKNQQYQDGAVAQALEDAFLAFDEHLTKEDVIETLKEIAGTEEDDEDGDDQDEVAGLFEEAEMPMDKLMERYGAANKSMDNLRDKGDDFQSPALRPKKDQVDKVEAEHIKQNMSNKLINGSQDNGDNEAATTVKDKDNVVSADNSNKGTKSEPISSDSSDATKPVNGSNGEKSSATSQGKDSSCPDSTQTDSKDSKTTASANTADKQTTSADVTSSSEGSGDGLATSSTGGGSSGAGGSSGGSSGGSGAGGSSSLQEQPSSSSGRKRSGRTGVIPAEGEDETSSEETSDSDDDLDEDDITESDSEDDDMAGFEGMDDDDDDDAEERGPLFSGGEEPGSDSGCTAVVAVLRNKELFVGNAGDSRCVVCRDGKAIDMSIDHKPEDELEKTRIEKAGGQVTEDNRVNGGLNLSRAIGDHVYKRNTELPLREQMISALPDVKSLTLTDKDEFMVIACDGIWNVMTSQDVCIFIRDRFKVGVTKISSIIEEMFDYCMSPDTSGDGTGCDNMTCIIVKFNKNLTDASSSQSASSSQKRPASDDDSAQAKKTKDGD